MQAVAVSQGREQLDPHPVTTKVPIPPMTTAGTVPNQWAVKPDSNSPNWFEAPMNKPFTALTRPRISSGEIITQL